ncbi:MAG: TVP38/TMEM64 family protein [Planctomycetaceae bacterium]|nr:TVP38/TMEM64 family protein [Planctomycetaceae bacterium]
MSGGNTEQPVQAESASEHTASDRGPLHDSAPADPAANSDGQHAAGESGNSSAENGHRSRFAVALRRGAILLVVATAGILFWNYRHLLTLQAVADHEATLRTWYQQSPVLFVAGAFGLYVAVTGTSLPGATVLTLACGWFFGFWPALVLVSFASTAGASSALLMSRYLLRDTVQHRFHGRLKTFNEALRREGAFYLFTLRLTPVVPFFVVNLVMGLTPMKLRTFWLVSQLGMLPGTCIYTWAGASIPSADRLASLGPGEVLSPRVIAALVLLGLFPLATKKLLGWLAPKALETVENSQS